MRLIHYAFRTKHIPNKANAHTDVDATEGKCSHRVERH